jgi:hypothetical protein
MTALSNHQAASLITSRVIDERTAIADDRNAWTNRAIKGDMT